MRYLEAVADVLTQIPSAPDFVITAAMNRATRKFCELSGAYRLRIENITVKEGLQTYDLDFYLPAKTTIHKVDSVLLANKRLQPATFKFVSQELGDSISKQDTPRYFVQPTPTQIELWQSPKETKTKGLEAQLILKPVRDADEIEDWFGEKYYEALIAGTVSEMSRTPNTEFYNPSLFPLMEQYFNNAIVEAKKEATGADRAVPRKVRYGGY
jgi:hypothetical protein